MYGKSYKVGRRAQRHTGGGGSMKPTNFSEGIFGILVLAFFAAIFILPFALFM
jgi:hypothetical protein